MPSGASHYRFFKAGYLIEIPEVIYLAFHNPIVAIGHFVGYSCHRWFDNDMDIFSASASESRLVNELKWFGAILYGVSSFYGAIFKAKHRSFWTHFPIVSSFIRMLLYFWWIIPLYIFNIIHFEYWHFELFYSYLWGISQADANHFFCDNIWEESKDGKLILRRKKKYRR